MTSIASRQTLVFPAGADAIPRERSPEAGRTRLPGSGDPRSTAPGAARFSATSIDANNLAGLGVNIEEHAFFRSEGKELETHEEAREAPGSQEQRVRELMSVEAIRNVYRMLAGDSNFFMLRKQAERFAQAWKSGNTAKAMEILDETRDGDERRLLMIETMARLKPGDAAVRLGEVLDRLPRDGEGLFKRLVALANDAASVASAAAPGSPAMPLMQSQPNPKVILEVAGTMGPDGLDALQKMLLPGGRVNPNASRGAEVYLGVTLLRTIQQLRQTNVVSIGTMNAAASA